MFIVNPTTQCVLTLKPDMSMRSSGHQTIISWNRPTFIHDKNIKTEFIINKDYNELIKDFKAHKKFIYSQWKEN